MHVLGKTAAAGAFLLASLNPYPPGSFYNTANGAFNVRDYGAKGDGATDDTTAIQNAVTAAAANGGKVIFPASANAYCVTTGPINVSATETLEGSNRQNGAILSACGADVAIFNLNAFRIVMRGLRIAGSETVDTTHDAVTMTASCTECLLSDMLISGGRFGINWAAGEAYLNDVKVAGTYGSLVYVTGGGSILRGKLDQPWPTTAPTARSRPANAVPAWAATTAYTAGASVVQVDGYMLQATQSGTSGGTAPTVLSLRQTIVDGTVRWQLAGPYLNAACSSTGVAGAGSPLCGAIQLDSGVSAMYIGDNTDTSGAQFYGVSFTNTKSTNAPQSVTIDGATFGDYYQHGINLIAGSAALTAINSQFASGLAANSNGVDVAGSDHTIINNFMFDLGDGVDIHSSATHTLVYGNHIGGCSNGVLVLTNATDFAIQGNDFNTAMWGGCSVPVSVQTGTSDFYNITNNQTHGAAVSDSGTGTHKTVTGNN